MSYADVTREDVKTSLGKNRLIIFWIIYFINVYLHWVTPGPCWLHSFSQGHSQPHQKQLSEHNLVKYTYTTSQTPGKMGIFYIKNKEKTPSDANKRGKGFGSGNTVQREDFAGTSEALNMLQVKFNCGERNKGGWFSEYLRLTTSYLKTKLKGIVDVKTLIQNGKVFDPAWPDPVGPNPATTKAMLQAE